MFFTNLLVMTRSSLHAYNGEANWGKLILSKSQSPRQPCRESCTFGLECETSSQNVHWWNSILNTVPCHVYAGDVVPGFVWFQTIVNRFRIDRSSIQSGIVHVCLIGIADCMPYRMCQCIRIRLSFRVNRPLMPGLVPQVLKTPVADFTCEHFIKKWRNNIVRTKTIIIM